MILLKFAIFDALCVSAGHEMVKCWIYYFNVNQLSFIFSFFLVSLMFSYERAHADEMKQGNYFTFRSAISNKIQSA